MRRTILGIYAIVALFAVLHESLAADKTKVKVEVYYESLCMDSIMFFKNQLVPSYSKLKDHLSITFVPYGKASQTKEDGKWRFQCQHGKSECDGNMAQACAIKAIQELNKPDEQDLLAQVLGCAMNTNYPPTAIPQCATNAKLEEDTLKRIDKCRKSDEAAELHAALGDKTLALDPILSFVPTIVVNGENHKDALRGFSRLICSYLTEDEKRAVC